MAPLNGVTVRAIKLHTFLTAVVNDAAVVWYRFGRTEARCPPHGKVLIVNYEH